MTWGDTACGGLSSQHSMAVPTWSNHKTPCGESSTWSLWLSLARLNRSLPAPPVLTAYKPGALLNLLALTWELPELPEIHLTSAPSKARSKGFLGTTFPVPQGFVKLSWLLPEDGGSWDPGLQESQECCSKHRLHSGISHTSSDPHPPQGCSLWNLSSLPLADTLQPRSAATSLHGSLCAAAQECPKH